MSMPSTIKDGDGDYLFIASGQTRYAPYLAGWQEFKDHVRKAVKEQPGWTNVIPGHRRGEVQGWCKLRDREDADAVYSSCSRSGGILVHIFATSLRNGSFELVRCNCTVHFPDVGNRGHSPRRSGVDVGVVNQAVGNRSAPANMQYPVSAQPAYQYANYYQASPYTASPIYSYPTTAIQPVVPQMPAYSQSTGGLPVNLGQGAVITESRGIFIQGISYNVGSNELVSLIHSAGLRPIEAKVHKDSRGASRGFGSAKFSSKAEAQYGVTALNGTTHMGKTLTVRLDTESTVVGQMPPVVVDGTIRGASRH